MFIRKVQDKKTGTVRIQICKNERVGGKVKQTIVRHVGSAKDADEVERFYKVAAAILEKEIEEKNGMPLLFEAKDEIEEQTSIKKEVVDMQYSYEERRVVEGPSQVYGKLFDEAGFSEILTDDKEELLKKIVIERISDPASKLQTVKNMSDKINYYCDENKVYRMMDKLEEKMDLVQKSVSSLTASLYNHKISLMCFDVTTLYFESISENDLRKFGFSKDQKHHQVQITLALATTEDGIPIGFKVFPGNTAEVTTLVQCIQEWRKFINIEDVVFVADRGMFSFPNLLKIRDLGLKFIVAAPLRKLSNIPNDIFIGDDYKCVQPSENGEIYWSQTFNYEMNQRCKNENNKYVEEKILGKILVSYNSNRAKKDKSDRDRLLVKIKKNLGGVKGDSKKLVSNSGYKKYAKFDANTYAGIDENKIKNDEMWDGLHGLFTNADYSSSQLIEKYRHLLSIEESFRICKTNLEMRPIYHYKPKRILSHVGICFLSLSLIRLLQYKLKKSSIFISPEKAKDSLNKVQYSILSDGFKKKYRVPSPMNPIASQIYETLGIKRRMGVTPLN